MTLSSCAALKWSITIGWNHNNYCYNMLLLICCLLFLICVCLYPLMELILYWLIALNCNCHTKLSHSISHIALLTLQLMSRLLSMLRSCSPEQKVSPSPTLAILLSERHSSRTYGQWYKPWMEARRLSLRSTNLSWFILLQSTCSIMLDCIHVWKEERGQWEGQRDTHTQDTQIERERENERAEEYYL